VLRAYGIPEEKWHLYAVDHSPRYNPDIEPDHEQYTLTPRLIADHNRKTAAEDGGFGNIKRGEGRVKSLETGSAKPRRQVSSHNVSKKVRGFHG
jgi:hypothetical protein